MLKVFKSLSCISLAIACVRYVDAVDLVDSYNSALSYNADFLASIAKNQAGQENQVQGRAALLPQVSATGGIQEAYLNANGGSIYFHQPTVGAQLQQVAFDFGKFSKYTKSQFATQVSDLQLELAKQQLMVNVAQAYFDVLYANDTLIAIRINKDAFERQLQQAKHAFKVGTVTIADVNDAQASFDAAVAEEIRDENDLINRKNIYRNITGLDPEQIQPLIKDINLVNPSPDDVNQWSKLAKTGNVNIKIARKQLEMANQDVSIAVSGHIPTLGANVNYAYSGSATIDGGNPNQVIQNSNPGSVGSSYGYGAVGVQANVPIYSGGGVSSQVRQAKSTYQATMQQLVSVERQTDQSIQNAFWQVQNGVSIVKAQTQALKSAQIKLKSDQTGYNVGIRNSVDLINSEKNLYQVIQSYNQSRYKYLNYRLQLKFLAGNIDADFLKQINTNIDQIVK
jgi:outer membrane protein